MEPSHPNDPSDRRGLKPVVKRPPRSFPRILLHNPEKYRRSPAGRNSAAPSQDAAASIAQQAFKGQRAGSSGLLQHRSSRAIFETIVITAAIPLIGYFVHKGDPFFLSHQFFW